MENDIKTWLIDILQAIDEINQFLPEKNNFFDFQKDTKTRRAIERNVEIIGEAVNRIIKLDPEINLSNSRKIVDTRNRIIHGYDSVSAEIIWGIVVRDMPKLEEEVKSLINQF
jgi:uncharacterized protein with HEPN domain